MGRIVQWAEQTLYYPNLEGKLDRLRLFPYQREIIDQVERHKFTVVCTPKRQGKTMISAVVALYFALLPNKSVLILSTSREHASGVAFKRIKDLVNYLVAKEPTVKTKIKSLSRTSITFKHNSTIETVPCVTSSIAGRTYDLLVIDELAYIEDEEVAEVAISQSEQPHTKILVTSTASSTDHLLYKLYLQSKEPKSGIHFIYLSGLESAVLNPLIKQDYLEMLRKTMAGDRFRNLWCNEWVSKEGSVVLSPEDITPCLRDIPCPIPAGELRAYFPDMVGWKLAVGIDRALPFSQHGDLSAGVAVAKILRDDGSYIYLVLDCKVFPSGSFEEITDWLSSLHQDYEIDQLCVEQYQGADIHDFALREGIPSEIIHVNRGNKEKAFGKLIYLVKTKKLVLPAHYEELVTELTHIQYKWGKYEAERGYHDDCVYALLWALWGAEKTEVIVSDIAPLPVLSARW